MIIFVCDKCKKKSEPSKAQYNSTPKDWRQITFHVNYSSGNMTYLICPKCQDKLGIPKGVKVSETIGDKLLDIITDIAMDAVADAEVNG